MTNLCPGGDLAAALAPYRALVDQVDQLCARIAETFADRIVCRTGCSACCILQGVLPVEAAGLALALARLPATEAESLRARLGAAADSDRCPLLTDDCCPLYAARPIICRTHGLPLLIAVHVTGLSAKEAEKLVSASDLVTACASKTIWEIAGAGALLQAGISVPIFAMTQKGKLLIIEKIRQSDEPVVVKPTRLPALGDNQPSPLV